MREARAGKLLELDDTVATVARMISSARRFNLDKVNREDLGRMSGPLLAEEPE